MKRIVAAAMICFLVDLLPAAVFSGQRFHVKPDDGSVSPPPAQTSPPPPAPIKKSGVRTQAAATAATAATATAAYGFRDAYPRSYLELNANASTAELRFGSNPDFFPDRLFFGLNGLVTDEDYFTISADLTYGNRMMNNRLALDIGIRAVAGDVEKGSVEDAVATALGLMAVITWDVPDLEVYYDRYIDLDLGAELCLAPKPLAFGDSERYQEARIFIVVHLLKDKTSSILLGYRDLRMDFDTDDDGEWAKNDEGLYFGYRLRF